jgi:hypothetical protein
VNDPRIKVRYIDDNGQVQDLALGVPSIEHLQRSAETFLMKER